MGSRARQFYPPGRGLSFQGRAGASDQDWTLPAAIISAARSNTDRVPRSADLNGVAGCGKDGSVKKHKHREPNGRLSRSEGEREFPPTTIRRIMDAKKREASDRRAGSELGRLYMNGLNTANQFAAGERWGALIAR